jgi:hypothetical protein
VNRALKLMIFGYARHGKDTAAEILCQTFGLTSMSSSLYAAKTVMVPYFEKIGLKYNSFDECYADRVNHRQEWFEEIKAYNTPDGARLGKGLLKEYDIYTGVRNDIEFEAIKAARLFDYSIWVDRSKVLPPEPTTSNKMLPSMANYILDNNGTLDQLVTNTRNLYFDLLSLEAASELR